MDNNLDDLAAQVHRWTPFIQMEEAKQTLELCQYLRDLVSNLKNQYPEMKFEVVCRNPIRIELATAYFSSIIRNLVDNSNYWTASKPERLVRITIFDDAEKAILRVSDNGTGISDEIRNNIFIPGWSSKPNGSGIGLKLAGEAANAIGGVLVLLHDSEIDKGASFELRLPIVKKNEP
jgi:signal transduction histidine kinase